MLAITTSAVLAESSPTGDVYLWIIGPTVVFLALALWIGMTIAASRRRVRPTAKDDGLPHRGDVMGGVVRGSPSQRNRRDPAPEAPSHRTEGHRTEGHHTEGRHTEGRRTAGRDPG